MNHRIFESRRANTFATSFTTASPATSAISGPQTIKATLMKAMSCALVFLLGAGCSSGQSFNLQNSSQAFAQQVTYAKTVDILWVIDNSGSMSPRQAMLAAQVPDFVTAINATGLDYQMAVTTMDMSQSGEKGRFLAATGTPALLNASTPDLANLLSARIAPGGNGSPVERGEEAMQAALNLSLHSTRNAGFLRKNSLLVVIFLSDEDDASAKADYASFLNALRPPLASGERSWISNFMGILPNDPQCKTSEWNFTDPGTQYIALDTLSGGTSESICSGDLREAINNVRARILEVVTEYHLDRQPNISTIQVTVNGALVASDPVNGWTYDSNKLAVVFHGTSVPAPDALINVTFTPLGEK